MKFPFLRHNWREASTRYGSILYRISLCIQQASPMGLNSGSNFCKMAYLVVLWYEEKSHTWGTKDIYQL